MGQVAPGDGAVPPSEGSAHLPQNWVHLAPRSLMCPRDWLARSRSLVKKEEEQDRRDTGQCGRGEGPS